MTITEPPRAVGNKGIPREGVDGFSQCWYPVALSSDVAAGELTGREFLDGRVVVYRGEDGVARVQSAYCRHLGSDLSVGDVRGNDVRCAFHHWQYGPDGMCTKIPAGVARIPAAARLLAYPAAESMGVIWAFNGRHPLYDPPAFPTYRGKTLEYRAYETRRWAVDPYVLLTNSMDFQHLRELHGMTMEFDPADIVMDGFEYEYVVEGDLPNFGRMNQFVHCFGNNAITLTMTLEGGGEVLGAFGGTPVPGGCRGFNIAAAVPSDGTDDDDERLDQVLFLSQAMMTQLQDEDQPVMDTIRFREDVLIDADRALGKFLRYVRDYPRAHDGTGLIN
ncbi:MAG TPA: Rieske 2Fe-2S domain-containing protein [Candidatus Nanopelagicales bacterium]|jgi:nitrite reductase/ring-hydroxylating ferredoxin subunit|nr:Rieske 2Fe-2S domain-containing protein [Candidatus Nanopelagicales bacterium]